MFATSRPVTFLFTDIEGSTRLWETDPAHMARALERHDRLCRSEVNARGGRVVKMIGDGLHAVFDDASAALFAVLELQRGMNAIAADNGIVFRMRCGLHTGVAQARDDDYFGSAVNRAARIMATAHGGQVLLSQAVVESFNGRLPDGTSVAYLGRVRLRDLAEPVEVWQLKHADLADAFPPLRSLDSTPNNLPRQLTSFVGREGDIASGAKLLGEARLITLTGAGGSGKTRLAVQLAAHTLDAFADGVWLVELGALSEGALVPQALATVVGASEQAGRTLVQSIAGHIGSKRLLLIMDNAEHVLDACREVILHLLSACPKLVVLSTSRQALNCTDERAVRVPSLPFPTGTGDVTVDQVMAYASVQLFVERAHLAMPRFVVTSDNASALASVCRRLDGIPLAIELAAARVRAMSPQQIDEHLDQRFRLVTGGSPGAPRRQQTLRALIDWSYDLLSEAEKALLLRSSAFAGGFTLESAEEICAGGQIETWETLDLLVSLVDKSLIAVEEREGTTRYRLLETVRQYAREKSLELGTLERVRERHRDHFLTLAEQAGLQLRGAEQVQWLHKLEEEYDNIREGLQTSLAMSDPTGGLRLCVALSQFWWTRGYLSEGREWCARALQRAPHSVQPERAWVLNTAGTLAVLQHDYPAGRALLEEALSVTRQSGDRPAVAVSLNGLANMEFDQGRFAAARALYEECLLIRRELGNRGDVANTLHNLGAVASDQGDYTTARSLYEESLAIKRSLGDVGGIGVTLHMLAHTACALGDYATGEALYDETLAIRRELRDKRGIANTLNNLGMAAMAQGKPHVAQERYEESLALKRELDDKRGIANTLHNMGIVALNRGDLVAARLLNAESLVIRRELVDRTGIADSLEGFAAVAWACEKPSTAARLWGAATHLREEIGAPLAPSERADYDRLVAAARAAAGPKAFDRAWQEGGALRVEQAIEIALGKGDDIPAERDASARDA